MNLAGSCVAEGPLGGWVSPGWPQEPRLCWPNSYAVTWLGEGGRGPRLPGLWMDSLLGDIYSALTGGKHARIMAEPLIQVAEVMTELFAN